MYARWWDARVFGDTHMYFERLPRNKYTGYNDALPKFARWVESDQNIMAMMAYSIFVSSSQMHEPAWSLLFASIHAWEVHSSQCTHSNSLSSVGLHINLVLLRFGLVWSCCGGCSRASFAARKLGKILLEPDLQGECNCAFKWIFWANFGFELPPIILLSLQLCSPLKSGSNSIFPKVFAAKLALLQPPQFFFQVPFWVLCQVTWNFIWGYTEVGAYLLQVTHSEIGHSQTLVETELKYSCRLCQNSVGFTRFGNQTKPQQH